MKKGAAKKKGRGFEEAGSQKSTVKVYESLEDDTGSGGPQRSVEVINWFDLEFLLIGIIGLDNFYNKCPRRSTRRRRYI